MRTCGAAGLTAWRALASVILTSSSDEKLTRARHVLELGGSGTLPQSITACRYQESNHHFGKICLEF